jgi:hypothetical protein
MELVARHFECYPNNSQAHRKLGALIEQIGEVTFPVSVGDRNSNQLTYDFDNQLLVRLVACGVQEATLNLPSTTRFKCDFAFTYENSRVVVEVEKANWEKILRDLLKIHIYFQHGVNFGLLFLPKNYPHSHGEPDNFDTGRKLYLRCLDSGFGRPSIFKRILLVGYEQFLTDGQRFTSATRNHLKLQGRSRPEAQ